MWKRNFIWSSILSSVHYKNKFKLENYLWQVLEHVIYLNDHFFKITFPQEENSVVEHSPVSSRFIAFLEKIFNVIYLTYLCILSLDLA